MNKALGVFESAQHIKEGEIYMVLKTRKGTVNKRIALRGSKGLMRAANKVILSHFDREFAVYVQETAEKEYEKLIPEIPYVGGIKNFFSEMPIKAAVILALYRTLNNEGVSLEEFGKILEEITTAYMNSFPAWVRNTAGKLWMSRLFRMLLLRQAKISKKRKYDDDFVYEVVSGEGKYKWGINYIECGIIKFLYNQGEVELTKYACILDYLMFPAIGVHLERTGTIAYGCERCDFRFS
jgi:hypothetical protein